MKKVLKVEGMACNHCRANVINALSKVAGVTEADADLASKTATVETSAPVEDQALVNAVEAAGYKVTEVK